MPADEHALGKRLQWKITDLATAKVWALTKLTDKVSVYIIVLHRSI